MTETATLEAPAPETTEKPEATLTGHDRCDSCGAQAYVKVTFKTGELLFCGHHAKAFDAKMSETATNVIDETWRLSDKRLDVSA